MHIMIDKRQKKEVHKKNGVQNYKRCNKDCALIVFAFSLCATRWHQLVFKGQRLSAKDLLL